MTTFEIPSYNVFFFMTFCLKDLFWPFRGGRNAKKGDNWDEILVSYFMRHMLHLKSQNEIRFLYTYFDNIRKHIYYYHIIK